MKWRALVGPVVVAAVALLSLTFNTPRAVRADDVATPTPTPVGADCNEMQCG